MKRILSLLFALALLVLPASSALAVSGDLCVDNGAGACSFETELSWDDTNKILTSTGAINALDGTSSSRINDTATNTVEYPVLVKHKKTAAGVADGFGVGILFNITENTTTNNAASIHTTREGANDTHALHLGTYKAGSVYSDDLVLDGSQDGAVTIANRLVFDGGSTQGAHGLIEAIVNASGTTQNSANYGATGRFQWQGQIPGIAIDVQNSMTAAVTGDWPGGGHPYQINSVLTMQNKAGSTGSTGALMGIVIMDRTAAGDYTEHAGVTGFAQQNSSSSVDALVWGLGSVAEKKNSGSVWGAIIELRNTYANDAGFVGLKIQSCCTGATEYSVGSAISITHDQSTNGFARALEYKDHTNADVFVIGNQGEVLSKAFKTTGTAGGKKVVCADTSTGILYVSSTGTDCSN